MHNFFGLSSLFLLFLRAPVRAWSLEPFAHFLDASLEPLARFLDASLEPFARFLDASLEPFVELRAVFYQRPQQIDTGSNNLHFFVINHTGVSPQEIFPLMDDAKNFAGLYFQ